MPFSQNLIPFEDPSLLIFIFLTFILSGTIKGFLGIGLPSAAMALLTIVIGPIEAISLLTIPIIFTNLVQYFRSSERKKTAHEFRFFSMTLILSIFITSLFITSYPTSLLTLAIGFTMIVFSINMLFGIKLPIGGSIKWHYVVGIISGVLGGLSSIWSPPIAMYLIARNYSKEKFVSITGFLFLSGSFPLAAGLYLSGVLTWEVCAKSGFGLVGALIGFRIGEIIRSYASENIFRKIILIFFLIMGARLIFESFF